MIKQHTTALARGSFMAALLLLAGACSQPQSNEPAPANTETTPTENMALQTGTWRFEMTSPGGPLPFTVTILEHDGGYKAGAHNDTEVLPFDTVTVSGNQVTLSIDHYESQFTGTLDETGTEISGEWTKLVDHTRTAKLPFTANHGDAMRFVPNNKAGSNVAGTWAVAFTQDGEPSGEAVADFRQTDQKVTGTFRTPTGDYRFLEGLMDGNQLKLSCYDGGHAFLFHAELGEDGTLSGEFWSSDKWYERWTAKRDADATLPEATNQNRITNDEGLFRFSFPNLNGETVSHDDAALQGKVRLVSIFGSWCPNCNDEAPLLQQLKQDYSKKGLAVIGLAFEATGDTARDTRALKRFAKRHKLDYPILLAGTKDKAGAGKMLPDLDSVLAYPTSLLINREGKVVRIHTGFNGPGTGVHHEKLVKDLRREIEKLL
ncbi:TlpA disulfide reductase family protein [Acanthopleuribacter pedis]|uniref:TlpA family protein disulfide reductase n=1 Tax=Acanthopleuribacter pedis TaxID=442870 RepID=A0A8J7QCP9_9BACT|nr:TlpA disulfide reductase family protein [Acanthopleuribacter pedis]MBO1317150.1 TlpA family protein disulfide reductase [Acanthopleuribacter pedis]